MSDMTYQVYFTGRDGKLEYFNQNFYSEDKAQEAVEQLIDKGFEDATFVKFAFTIEAYAQ